MEGAKGAEDNEPYSNVVKWKSHERRRIKINNKREREQWMEVLYSVCL